MIEFDSDEINDLKLAVSREVAGRHFQFVMIVRKDVWKAFLGLEAGSTKPVEAYEKAKPFWEKTLLDIADAELARLELDTPIKTHAVYPALEWLEKRRAAAGA